MWGLIGETTFVLIKVLIIVYHWLAGFTHPALHSGGLEVRHLVV
jgi:hypothetical protein